jgi:hypothetical protein
MLSSRELPPNVRFTILKYVEEKLAGLYGHNKKQLRRFRAFMVDATALTDFRTIPRSPSSSALGLVQPDRVELDVHASFPFRAAASRQL